MSTYKQIQKYVKEKYNVSVKTCWIAHVKEINGLNPRPSPNRISIINRSNPCPDNKRQLIESAMRHFGILK